MAKQKQMTVSDFQRMLAIKAHYEANLAPILERIEQAQTKLIDAKNVADDAKTEGNNVWKDIFSIAAMVHDATVKNPEYRYELFTDAMEKFIVPAQGPDGKPLKLTTAGQYASTARKLLVDVCTAQHRDIAEFMEMSVKEVREEFKDSTHAALNEAIGETAKNLRYVVKYGTDDERKVLEAYLAEAVKLYNPVKARRDAASKKGQAAKAVPELQQQAPADGGVVETVAADLADDGGDKAAAAVGE